MIGETISHYEILEELGRGGMGVVYKARDTKLNRTVALKFLSPNVLGTGEDKARFLHEAQAAAALNHPNICTIHEIEESDGQSFIAMECVEGECLRDMIRSGPLRLEEAVDIAVQVASGMQEAHEKKIVHRDIKSANIMITRKGRAKIMDFGLAKAGGQTVLTRTDTTLGTYAYMSPEQARGENVDPRTDIWSLGVVLYEMITGRRPFRGDYEQAVVYSIINEEPEPPTALRSGVPMELERIVIKCLRKEANQRYQGTADLITDLRQVSESLKTSGADRSTAIRPARRGGRMRWAWLAVAALLAVCAAVLLPRYFTTKEKPIFDGRKMLVVLPFENLGAPEDEYFAAGMTEEITSRLAAVSGLGVISRTSAVQYDRTGMSVKRIGEDLGVDYILEGTVRWNKRGEGGSRVRVTPQLIRVSDDTHLWAETYDRVLEDIFAVQSDIAERIIEQLGITMLERERDVVESKPTENLLAYEAYLRGIDHLIRAGAVEERWRKAETLFRQAVELDSTFALAYAKLSIVHGEFYFWGFDRSKERLAKCKATAERSLELQPDLPEAHIALGGYYYMGFFDYDRSLREYAIAAKSMPNNPYLFEQIAYIWRRQGLFTEGIGYLEKAATLDPANFWYYMQIGLTYGLLRQYEEAERYLDRSLSLDRKQNASYFIKSRNVVAWTGDVQRARAVLESCPSQDAPIIIVTFYLLDMYERDYQGALNRLSVIPGNYFDFATDITPPALLAGFAHQLLGDSVRARASYDSARVIMETVVQERPDDGSVHSALGMVYAGLGRSEDALREGERGMELSANDAILVTEREWDYVIICILLGEHETALDHIEHLLSVPSLTTVPFLEVQPIVDPLRENPRYKMIIGKFAGKAP
jgi:TolB-like protein/tRNA A-37 threonylcarbamoyl transferase component Bud32/Flp pilus assembly protein TadD